MTFVIDSTTQKALDMRIALVRSEHQNKLAHYRRYAKYIKQVKLDNAKLDLDAILARAEAAYSNPNISTQYRLIMYMFEIMNYSTHE